MTGTTAGWLSKRRTHVRRTGATASNSLRRCATRAVTRAATLPVPRGGR